MILELTLELLEQLKIAARLRNETLVTVAWIAQPLRMGSVANVNTLLYQWRQDKYKKSLFIRPVHDRSFWNAFFLKPSNGKMRS